MQNNKIAYFIKMNKQTSEKTVQLMFLLIMLNTVNKKYTYGN